MVGDDGRGMVWPDDVPPEVEQQARGREGEALGAKKGPMKRVPELEARGREVAAAGERAAPEAGGARATGEAPAGAIPAKPKKPRKRSRPGGDSPLVPNGADASESPARANLVAVPPIAAAKKDIPSIPLPLAQRAPKAEGARPAPRIVSGERRPNAAPRAKRELPPYLRVVK
jgi:hypothetical protein